MSNEQMVSFPRELSDEMAERIARASHVCGGGAYEIWEAICKGFGKPADQHQVLPELTDDLREILGRPNFTCHHIAKALRVMGHTIKPKSEDEQAVVIHWLLSRYLKHGVDWRQHASAELEVASKLLKA